jgi:hypothetical protein
VLLPHGQRPVGFRGLTATSLTPRSASRARVAQTTPKSQANASGTVVSWPSVVLSVSLGTFEVNVVAPAGMVRGNAYAATKAALEAHTVNLAAELRGTGVTGVTVNAYRPGGVDTAMQTWIRGQDYGRIGAGLHGRFNKNFADGVLITPEHSAAAPLAHLAGDDTGAIWDVSIGPRADLSARPANAAGGGRAPRHRHRQRPRNPDLLDGDDVHRPDGGVARKQLVGGLAERLGQRAGDVRLASVLAGEGIEDPVVGRIDPERVPGDCLLLGGRELAAGPEELA